MIWHRILPIKACFEEWFISGNKEFYGLQRRIPGASDFETLVPFTIVYGIRFNWLGPLLRGAPEARIKCFTVSSRRTGVSAVSKGLSSLRTTLAIILSRRQPFWKVLHKREKKIWITVVSRKRNMRCPVSYISAKKVIQCWEAPAFRMVPPQIKNWMYSPCPPGDVGGTISF